MQSTRSWPVIYINTNTESCKPAFVVTRGKALDLMAVGVACTSFWRRNHIHISATSRLPETATTTTRGASSPPRRPPSIYIKQQRRRLRRRRKRAESLFTFVDVRPGESRPAEVRDENGPRDRSYLTRRLDASTNRDPDGLPPACRTAASLRTSIGPLPPDYITLQRSRVVSTWWPANQRQLTSSRRLFAASTETISSPPTARRRPYKLTSFLIIVKFCCVSIRRPSGAWCGDGLASVASLVSVTTSTGVCSLNDTGQRTAVPYGCGRNKWQPAVEFYMTNITSWLGFCSYRA